MNHPSSVSLTVFSLLLFISHNGAAAEDITVETCRKSAESSPNLNFTSCVNSLQSDPRSSTANLQQLGIISMELSLTNATYINSYIKKLLNDKDLDDFTRIEKYLRDCSELYGDAISNIEEAVKAFDAYDSFSANIKMSAAMDSSTTCEDGFKDNDNNQDYSAVSPLVRENYDFFQLTAVSLAITNLVRHSILLSM
ncbi:hypothetical protein C5167_028414 [Papaver somniferum]|uniref:putative invertase inhibitor n=1 Tax=Papaver somniferum TaxID=3469 RepID=UPI000E6FCB4D|nr:putative invertase inhibitor [Papaver somniferum]RZC93056.1 hypothetical protein C5167_028414 [Papaver somniferum]